MSSCFHCPTTQAVDPPRVVFQDFFHPQIVQVIHPIEIVTRHHCVPVPEHIFLFNERDEFCPSPAPVAYVKSLKRKKIKR